MENMVNIFIDHFSKLVVQNHVKSIEVILDETDLKVGPSLPEGYS